MKERDEHNAGWKSEWRRHGAGCGRRMATGGRKGYQGEVVFQREAFSWTSLRDIEIDGRRFYQGIVRDITERKRVEQALRDSEERLRLALEASRMVAWEWEPGQDPAAGRLLQSANAGEIWRRCSDARSTVQPGFSRPTMVSHHASRRRQTSSP